MPCWINSRRWLKKAKVEIKAYRAMGGGWEVRENRDFVPAAMQEEMARRTDWGKLLNPDLLRPQAPALPSAEDVGPTVRPPEW